MFTRDVFWYYDCGEYGSVDINGIYTMRISLAVLCKFQFSMHKFCSRREEKMFFRAEIS